MSYEKNPCAPPAAPVVSWPLLTGMAGAACAGATAPSASTDAAAIVRAAWAVRFMAWTSVRREGARCDATYTPPHGSSRGARSRAEVYRRHAGPHPDPDPNDRDDEG